MSWQIKKLGYSAKPWRVVDEAGREVWVPEDFDHPMLGRHVVGSPLGAETKAALVQRLLDVVESLWLDGIWQWPMIPKESPDGVATGKEENVYEQNPNTTESGA